MDQPDQEVVEVLVVVAMPPMQYRPSEEAWEQDVLDAVSAAIHADKTIDALDVKLQEYEDCEWVFEGGMPMPDFGITVFQDGSWHTGDPFPREEPEVSGETLQALFDYLAKRGLMKK
jgi:hypothetical protein